MSYAQRRQTSSIQTNLQLLVPNPSHTNLEQTNRILYVGEQGQPLHESDASREGNGGKTSTQARSTGSGRAKAWLMVVIGLLIVLPLLGWGSLALLGERWIDQAKLDTYVYQLSSGESTFQNGQRVTHVAQMPAYVSETLLAVEDHRFYIHPGVDPIGIVRSLWVDLSKGHRAQGGSTITMQVARNLFLTHEKTIERKVKEIAIAANLEWRYSKEQILDMYLNRVNFGHGKYGIEEAARYYFGKTTLINGELPFITQAETAFLIGLLKAPGYYSASEHIDEAMKRQRIVLYRMRELKWLTDYEWREAQEESLQLKGQS